MIMKVPFALKVYETVQPGPSFSSSFQVILSIPSKLLHHSLSQLFPHPFFSLSLHLCPANMTKNLYEELHLLIIPGDSQRPNQPLNPRVKNRTSLSRPYLHLDRRPSFRGMGMAVQFLKTRPTKVNGPLKRVSFQWDPPPDASDTYRQWRSNDSAGHIEYVIPDSMFETVTFHANGLGGINWRL
ncbi:unnamed protein product [Caretta caretta]